MTTLYLVTYLDDDGSPHVSGRTFHEFQHAKHYAQGVAQSRKPHVVSIEIEMEASFKRPFTSRIHND